MISLSHESSTSQYAVELIDLSKSFGTLKAVDSLSISVPRGEIYGFLGPNGAGKTTTLKMIAGLIRPDSGRILLSGEEVSFGSTAGRLKLGYLPDVPECYGYMTPVEFLNVCAGLFGIKHNEARVKIDEVLGIVGLKGVRKRIGGFSRGMKQRMGIAQALINNPEIILMDEPVSALDPEGRYDIIEVLRNLKGRTTVFFSTHIISDIEKVCDSISVISQGQLLEHGSVKSIKSKYDKNTILLALPADTDEAKATAFADAIKARNWLKTFEARSSTDFKITVSDKGVSIRELPVILSQMDLPLEFLDSVSVSLEDIFLEVIRK